MKKNMTLSYILHDLTSGGVETALLSAISKLSEEYSLHIICIGHIDANFSHEIAKTKCQVKQLNYPIWLLPLAIFRAIRYLTKIKPDVTIASLWKASLAGGLFKVIHPKTLFLSFIHSNKFFNLPDSICTKFALKKCNTIFCDSKASAKFITPYAHGKQTVIISFLRFSVPNIAIAKTNLKLNAIFLGRLSQPKRIDRLLALIHKCKIMNINISLDIFGRDSKNLKNKLLAQVAELDIQQQITFKDQVHPQQVQDVLKEYDFYMQTSENEGMAMSVVEAMQMGLVPIVTSVGEIKHYTQDMYNAIIVPSNLEGTNYLENIAKVINSISLYNKLSQNAHDTFVNQPEYADSLVYEINNLIKK